MHTSRKGFTIVELMVCIAVIAILAGIVIVGYGAWRKHVAQTEVKSDLGQAASLLRSVYNFHNTYPTSLYSDQLSDDDKPSFHPSKDVTVILHTNATTLPHYSGLTQAQNVQLFLDACNSAMPAKSGDGSTNYHTACNTLLVGFIGVVLSGDKTARLASPIPSNFTISCITGLLQPNCTNADYESSAAAAATAMKQRFTMQGGTFPVTIPLLFVPVVLPAPDSVYTYDDATTFCLDGVSVTNTDVVYHVESSAPNTIADGECPS